MWPDSRLSFPNLALVYQAEQSQLFGWQNSGFQGFPDVGYGRDLAMGLDGRSAVSRQHPWLLPGLLASLSLEMPVQLHVVVATSLSASHGVRHLLDSESYSI